MINFTESGAILKRSIYYSLLCICLLTLVCSCRSKAEYALSLPKHYLTVEDNSADLAELLQTDHKKLEEYCKKNDLLYFAADKNTQIKFWSQETDFSTKINSFSELNDENRNLIIEKFAGTYQTGDFVKGADGNNYLRLVGKTADNNKNVFNTTEYITVSNGKMYTLAISANANVSDPAESIFSGLQIHSAKNNYGVLILLGIIILAVLTVFLIYTVIRDLKPSKNDQNEN